MTSLFEGGDGDQRQEGSDDVAKMSVAKDYNSCNILRK